MHPIKCNYCKKNAIRKVLVFNNGTLIATEDYCKDDIFAMLDGINAIIPKNPSCTIISLPIINQS